jgi:hypothetical protein
MGLARRAQGARRRRCGVSVDDEQRIDRRATTMRPSDSGFVKDFTTAWNKEVLGFANLSFCSPLAPAF